MTSDDGQVITDDELHAARHMRLKMLQDPYRPAYHFVNPEGWRCRVDRLLWRTC